MPLLLTGVAVMAVTGRMLVAALFLFTAAGKLRDMGRFRGVLADYRLLPAALVTPASVLLVMAEGGVALALIASPRAGAAGAIALLLLFAGAMQINIARNHVAIDCGCSLSRGQGLSKALVLRNLLLCLPVSLSLFSTEDIGGLALANCAIAGFLLCGLMQIFAEIRALRASRYAGPAAWRQI